jgi:hypothetical protein
MGKEGLKMSQGYYFSDSTKPLFNERWLFASNCPRFFFSMGEVS